jgi:hypothetical protein
MIVAAAEQAASSCPVIPSGIAAFLSVTMSLTCLRVKDCKRLHFRALTNRFQETPVRDREKVLERKPLTDCSDGSKSMTKLVRFQHFNTIKYKSPQSKTFEASLTGEPMPAHFKALKCNRKGRALLSLLNDTVENRSGK